VASVRWTVGAREDLRDITGFIGKDSEVYAAVVAGRMVAAVERLRRYPRLGRGVPEYEDETIRELIVGNYRIVYRIQGQRVGIIAIVHGSRDLLMRLAREPWDFR
jgi:plasmid stabilization system protein ParE